MDINVKINVEMAAAAKPKDKIRLSGNPNVKNGSA